MDRLVRFDWAMKYLLRNKANFDILEGFLSELLHTSITIETLLESEGNQNHEVDKYNRVDLLAKTSLGQHVIIELQCNSQWDYLSRILYGTSKAVCEHLDQGMNYGEIPKVISVSIVFFDLGEGKDYLYHGCTTFRGIHYHDTLNLNDKERKVYSHPNGLVLQTPEEIFPEYYIIKVTAFADRVQGKFDEWMYFLKYSNVKEEFTAQGIQSAAKKLNVLRLSESERRVYAKFKESTHDNASWAKMMSITAAEAEVAKADAETAKADAEAAKADAEAARFETGTARKNLKKVAMTLLNEGYPLEIVVQLTGVSPDELQTIFQ